MDKDKIKDRISQIEFEIEKLPKGNLSIKKIYGKEQPYLQWTENGKRKSKYIKAAEREDVIKSLDRRKVLESEMKELLAQMPHENEEADKADVVFETHVIEGRSLQNMCEKVSGYKCRDCMRVMEKYLEKGAPGRVCLLYGLRRTGKTTLLLQAISKLPLDKTVYVKMTTDDDIAALERDLIKLNKAGYRYIFIDEVTLLKDFIDSASMFSDIYAMMGMKIVMSGTDSLGFFLSTEDELYDRAYMIHTTFIPFREYARLLGISDIDQYIRYGGTFRMGETDFDDTELMDESVSFRDDESTRRYIDTAIAHNIQHSLAHYRRGTHFQHLIDLYDAGELTSAVNRIIEDINHRFVLSILTKDFLSNDLGISKNNLRKNIDPGKRSSALDGIDEKTVTESLKKILDIRNKDEMSVELTADHVREIKEYLYMLDLIVNCPIETIQGKESIEHIIITQPGMRYVQAQALVHSLMKDELFMSIDAKERAMVTERILEEVRGRIMEEIILLETMKASNRSKRVFKLQFPVGEYDMVVVDESEPACSIYEIKHSTEMVPMQYRFLVDKEKCSLTEHRYGEIQERVVIYRGKTQTFDGVSYQNVEEYLEVL